MTLRPLARAIVFDKENGVGRESAYRSYLGHALLIMQPPQTEGASAFHLATFFRQLLCYRIRSLTPVWLTFITHLAYMSVDVLECDVPPCEMPSLPARPPLLSVPNCLGLFDSSPWTPSPCHSLLSIVF